MASTSFTARVTRIAAEWLNEVNDLVHSVFGGASTVAGAKTALGLGTADSPQFTAVSIGATDTTLTRTGAGDIAVEGNAVYRAGGTDVAVADGGTGASDASTARTNLGVGTGDSPLFAGVSIGAVDTTLTRTGAGDIAVEGNAVYRAGGTDVAVADGGTGASTAVVARANLAIAPIGIPENIALSSSVGSNALTMAIKGEDGNDPSATNVVAVRVPNGTGGVNRRTITAATSLVISSGSTLGHNSALKQYIYWYLIDNSGTLELAASSKFFGWHGTVSTTAEGAAGAADSGTVMYSTTARSSVPFVCIAYSEDTQTVAGTWASNLSAIYIVPFSHPVISFKAAKVSAAQTPSGSTKVTFENEAFDNGALFDNATNYRWVPPPGKVVVGCNIITINQTDNSQCLVEIKKSGSTFARTLQNNATGSADSVIIDVSVIDECNGTDYYEVFVTIVGNKNIGNGASDTYFYGDWSPMRS